MGSAAVLDIKVGGGIAMKDATICHIIKVNMWSYNRLIYIFINIRRNNQNETWR